MNQDIIYYWKVVKVPLSTPDQLAGMIKEDQEIIEENDPHYPTSYEFAVARLPILLAEQALRSNDVPTPTEDAA